ncbi:MAG: sigma-54 dependent transcriptional regulator [Deltaproteobacteria bacterium]|nr:sigma-54 dependent transcriptional regulator [Deltaproteobacteria bacterium]
MARILVVDDEAPHRDSLRRIFERAGHEVALAKDGAEAQAFLQTHAVDVVLTDLVMPNADGLSVLQAVKDRGNDADVVLMTAYGNVENAVQAMRQGAADFLTKPTRRGELLACLDRVLERRRLLSENRALKAELTSVLGGGAVAAGGAAGLDRIVGTSTAIQAVKNTLSQVAGTRAPVLLVGEPGTGKELCARALHELSPRASAPFVVAHGAALVGLLERARGGTLFLDEVSELTPAAQVTLLGLLQDGAVDVGAGPVPIDVRVVAATGARLADRVREGRFREDLSWSLDVVSVALPPLREREGDVALLAATFLTLHAARHGRGVAGFEPRALQALSSWTYPGNVRELSHAVERAVLLCPDGQALRFDDLPPAIRAAEDDEAARFLTFRIGQMSLPQMERAAIDATMVFAAGDKVQAAKLLGLSLRTLYRRLGEKPGVEAFSAGDDGDDDT